MNSYPSPVEIIKTWIQGRAESGVVLAQAVTEVTVEGDEMTIHIDPYNFPRSKEWSTAVSVYPGGIVEFYAVEFGWTNDQSMHLRSLIKTVQVLDAHGHPIGQPLDTTEFQKRVNPEIS